MEFITKEQVSLEEYKISFEEDKAALAVSFERLFPSLEEYQVPTPVTTIEPLTRTRLMSYSPEGFADFTEEEHTDYVVEGIAAIERSLDFDINTEELHFVRQNLDNAEGRIGRLSQAIDELRALPQYQDNEGFLTFLNLRETVLDHFQQDLDAAKLQFEARSQPLSSCSNYNSRFRKKSFRTHI